MIGPRLSIVWVLLLGPFFSCPTSEPPIHDAPELDFAVFEVPPCPHPVQVATEQLLEELRWGRFAEVSQGLRGHQAAFEASILCESELCDAFEDLGDREEDWLGGALDRWVDRAPDDYVARSLRGHWWVNQGFLRRGKKWARETSGEQFRGMRAAFRHAERDLRRAIELNPRHLPAYNELIDLMEASSRSGEALDVFHQGLAVQPLSYRLRRTRIHYLKPRWRGSHEAMESFAGEAQRHAAESPKLPWLLGYPHADRASVASRDDRHREALQHYTKALAHHRHEKWLVYRADAYLEIGDVDAALRDLGERLERHGEDADTLRRRGKAYNRVDRHHDALRDLDRAVALAPDDYYVRTQRAWAHIKLRNDEAAEGDLRAALAQKPDSAWPLRQLAWLLKHQEGRLREAVPVYRKLLEVEPDDPDHWRNLGDALFDLDDPEHREVLGRYLELADPADPEQREGVEKVRAYLEEGVIPEV